MNFSATQPVIRTHVRPAWNSDDDVSRPVEIRLGEFGICLHFPGYGDAASTDDGGEPVFIEFYEGHPRVLVWSDIQQEDPTHVISLENASLSRRLPENAQQ